MQSVLSTALSRLNSFMDSELEQILCFDTAIDAEQFCRRKTAVFLVMPEEDNTKYFIISLILQQLYREILMVADENGGKLDNRVAFYYYELLNTSLYKKVLSGSEYKEQMKQIKACGYMTSVTEVDSCLSIISKYDLTKYDDVATEKKQTEINRPILRFGCRGQDVAFLQERLTEMGYDAGEIDGIFGVKVLGAVKAIQIEKGLIDDGIVGVKTWAILQ